MTPNIMTYLTDLSEAQTDDTCARKRWYASYEGGRGIIAKHDLIKQRILADSLDDMRMIAQTPLSSLGADSLEEAVTDILSGLTPEQRRDRSNLELLYRRLGWLVAWASFIEPSIRPVYEDIAIDPIVTLRHQGLQVDFPTGRLLRFRHCREVVYVSFVPTPYASSRWKESWLRRAEPHVEMRGVADAAQVNINAMQVRGLAQGYYTNITLNHPYVFAYQNIGTGEWTHSYTEGCKTGWRQRPVWEYEGGLVDWVLKCGRDVAESQFPLSQRILFNPRIFEGWVTHRLHRERLIVGSVADAHGNFHARNLYFPQNTAHCRPLHEEACQFQDLCWASMPVTNPMASGNYLARPIEVIEGVKVVEETDHATIPLLPLSMEELEAIVVRLRAKAHENGEASTLPIDLTPLPNEEEMGSDDPLMIASNERLNAILTSAPLNPITI